MKYYARYDNDIVVECANKAQLISSGFSSKGWSVFESKEEAVEFVRSVFSRKVRFVQIPQF